MSCRNPWLLVLAWILLLNTTAPAQQPGTRSQGSSAPRRSGASLPTETSEVASGWSLLAQGQIEQAKRKAAQILATNPRNAGALLLGVEADIASDGATAALTLYERWLGQRTLEEPGVVRRIAGATLREEANQTQDAAARMEALRALAADGDAQAAAELAQLPAGTGGAASRAAAATGDGRAVNTLIAQLKSGIVDVRGIDALGDSGNKAAIGPLTAQLGDPRPHIRGAVATALGKLGDPSVAATLKPLLADPSSSVRINAAGALYRLGDSSGLPLLQQLMAEQSPEVRLGVAEVMASRPDGTWISLVRELTTVPNPEIQARAAGLLAPHDPEAARKVLEALAGHENPAIRELASQGLGDVATSDLSELRRLLRNTVHLTKVRAAARVLEVTR